MFTDIDPSPVEGLSQSLSGFRPVTTDEDQYMASDVYRRIKLLHYEVLSLFELDF